jgi:hypothetical protein
MKKHLLLLFMVVVISFFAGAQEGSAPVSLMQLAKLTASDGTVDSQFGKTMAASGNTMVVNHGSEVYVFVKPAAGWSDSTETALLVPSNGTAGFFAAAVSGNVVAVSALEANQIGDVYVFVRPAGGWSGNVTETAILGDRSQFCFGSTIGISANTIAVGTGTSGAFGFGNCIFVMPAGGWKNATHAAATLTVPINATNTSVPLAISANTVVIAVPGSFETEGTLYAYVKPASGWSGTLDPTAVLIASDGRPEQALGGAIAISGNTIVATSENSLGLGRVYIFVEPSSGWVDTTETAQLRQPPNAIAFALSVAIGGNTVAVGAPLTTVGFNQLQGTAYVYLKPQGGWKTTSKFDAELASTDGAANDNFGTGLAIGGGNVFVGAPFATISGNSLAGAAYVFGQ